jgi:PEGA domain
MGTLLARLVLGGSVAVVVLIPASLRISEAQPVPAVPAPAPAPADATPRAAARKLVREGIAAQNAKDYDRAIALYMRAFTLDPHPLLLFNVGQAFRLADCPERAVPFYERYLALDPDGAESATARAILAEIKDRRPQDPTGSGSVSQAPCRASDDALGRPPAAAAISTGRITLRSTPDGMSVMLDGAKTGVTPIELVLAAGPHRVVLLDGSRRVGEQTVEVAVGAVAEVTIPVEAPASDSGRRKPPRMAPAIIGVAGGLLTLATGTVLLALDEDPVTRPDQDTSRRYLDSGTGGAIIGLGGLAVAGVGGYLLWKHSRWRSMPAVSPVSGGAVVGLTRLF